MGDNNYVRREAKNGFLLIDADSNYGISHYKPRESNLNDSEYKMYLEEKKKIESNPNYVFINQMTGEPLSREKTEKLVHCMGCAAPKINNWKRYCCLCKDFFDKKE